MKKIGEQVSTSGRLIVITGTSGSGKDSIVDEILQLEEIISKGYRKVVTHATREKREGEIEGYSYYFIDESTIFEMHERGELVEPPTSTGDSYKATSKKELLKVVEEGQNLVWRIDLSRAAEVASGEFFDNMFESELANVLKENI